MPKNLGMAAAFSEKWFSGPTRLVENPIASLVGTSMTLMLMGNPDRVEWLIMNRSNNNIAIGFGQDLTLAGGWLLTPNGGYISMNVQEDGEAVTYPLYAIAAAAASQIYILEIRKP